MCQIYDVIAGICVWERYFRLSCASISDPKALLPGWDSHVVFAEDANTLSRPDIPQSSWLSVSPQFVRNYDFISSNRLCYFTSATNYGHSQFPQKNTADIRKMHSTRSTMNRRFDTILVETAKCNEISANKKLID